MRCESMRETHHRASHTDETPPSKPCLIKPAQHQRAWQAYPRHPRHKVRLGSIAHRERPTNGDRRKMGMPNSGGKGRFGQPAVLKSVRRRPLHGRRRAIRKHNTYITTIKDICFMAAPSGVNIGTAMRAGPRRYVNECGSDTVRGWGNSISQDCPPRPTLVAPESQAQRSSAAGCFAPPLAGRRGRVLAVCLWRRKMSRERRAPRSLARAARWAIASHRMRMYVCAARLCMTAPGTR